MELVPPATSEELAEILAQLGAVGYTTEDAAENMIAALENFGLTPEIIADEVREQRGR